MVELGFPSIETGRLAVFTVVLVTAVTVLATYAVPRLAAAVARSVDSLLERWGVRTFAAELWAHTPPGVSLATFVRSAQALIFLTTAFFLLGMWGQERGVHAALHVFLDASPNLVSLCLTAVMVAVMYAGSHYIGEWVSGLGDEADYFQDHTTEIIIRSLQLVLLLGGALTILSIWRIDIDNFLIGAGVASVIIGFAARSTFSSVVSGFVLMFSRPFEVGDWVEVSDTEGQVTDVTIVNTRLRTPEGERIVLPNDVIGNDEIINYSEEPKLCVPFEVGVAYDTDLDRATDVIEDALSDVDIFSSGSTVEVFPQRFGDSAVVLEVRFWVDHAHPLTRRRARANAVRRIKAAFAEAGIEIPFPQRDLNAGTAADTPPADVLAE